MTFDALLETLPNGLHDSQMTDISINYMLRQIKLNLKVWVGEIESNERVLREAYKPAVITVSKFDFCVIECPDNNYPFKKTEPLVIDAGQGVPSTKQYKLPDIDSKSFLFWIWVSQWNSFIQIAAQDMQLDWI